MASGTSTGSANAAPRRPQSTAKKTRFEAHEFAMQNMGFVAREMTRVPTFVSRCTKIMHTSHGEWEALRSQSVWSSMVSCLLRCGVDGGLSLAVLAIAVEVIATWVLFTIDPSGVLSR